MNKYNAARQYLNLEIDAQKYAELCGEDVRFMSLSTPVTVQTSNIVKAIQQHRDGELPANELVKWVNIVWFSDAFEFDESCVDSIVSVMDQLECLDENGVSFSDEQYKMMIEALENNKDFPCLYT